jgi:hypothetical protein
VLLLCVSNSTKEALAPLPHEATTDEHHLLAEAELSSADVTADVGGTDRDSLLHLLLRGVLPSSQQQQLPKAAFSDNGTSRSSSVARRSTGLGRLGELLTQEVTGITVDHFYVLCCVSLPMCSVSCVVSDSEHSKGQAYNPIQVRKSLMHEHASDAIILLHTILLSCYAQVLHAFEALCVPSATLRSGAPLPPDTASTATATAAASIATHASTTTDSTQGTAVTPVTATVEPTSTAAALNNVYNYVHDSLHPLAAPLCYGGRIALPHGAKGVVVKLDSRSSTRSTDLRLRFFATEAAMHAGGPALRTMCGHDQERLARVKAKGLEFFKVRCCIASLSTCNCNSVRVV